MIGESPEAMPDNPEISVVVPVRNEEDNVQVLARQLRQALPSSHEVIFVDDGSTDGTWARLAEIHERGRVRLVRFAAGCGKSAALMVGFARCRGPIIFTLDGDLQDDPAEIPRFLTKLAEGYGLVSGWKKVRHDPLHKVAASRVFNFVMRKASGLDLHDMNCGFKCYRAEVAKRLQIYGDQHRFIPVFAADWGYTVAEIEVGHRPRMHGRSKYGLSRLAKGFADLGTVLLRTRYKDRPAHAFGVMAAIVASKGLALLAVAATGWLPRPAEWAVIALGAALVASAPAMLAAGWVSEYLLHLDANSGRLQRPAIRDARD